MKHQLYPEVQNALDIGLRIIIANNGFIPDGSYELFHQIVPWPAVEVAITDGKGRILLHYREFVEWPGEFARIKGWYVPGGYMKVGRTIEEDCLYHIQKDGVQVDGLKLVDIAGIIKWAPGEHPFAHLVSILCVCEPLGPIVLPEGGTFRFVNEVVRTNVPHHTRLQEMFFEWVSR